MSITGMATRRAPPSILPASQIRDDLAITDPGLLLKEKIRLAEAAARKPAPAKDALTEPGLAFKEKVHAGNKIPKGTTTLTVGRSTDASIDSTSATSSSGKGSTAYKIKSHRTRTTAASEFVPSAPPLEEVDDEPSELLTKQQQQHRDLFDEDEGNQEPARSLYTPELTESELETRSVDQLQSYAVLRSQDVSQNIRECVRVAEETTGIAATTMETLHEQGTQIRRSHLTAVKVEEELTVGEKVLGSLGGFFSRKWKPKKGPKIKGPELPPDSYKKQNAEATRAALVSAPDSEEEDAKRARARANKFEGLSATDVQLEMEREHQDDALSSLGDIVSKLKDMTYVMNEEVERQTADIGRFQDDVEVIDNRVKQSYNRTRYLTGR